MAWQTNVKETKTEWEDVRGRIGGVARAADGGAQTYLGPIYSPNGTAHWIEVSDVGALTATTTDPT